MLIYSISLSSFWLIAKSLSVYRQTEENSCVVKIQRILSYKRRMLQKHSKSKKYKINVGDSLVLWIIKVNCGPLDPKNILGKVLQIDNDVDQINRS